MGWAYLGIALVSGAALLYKVALTRLLAIAQDYHLVFSSSVSPCSAWARAGRHWRFGTRTDAARRRQAFFPPSPRSSGYFLANYLPFDPYRLAWEPAQCIFLAAYLLALAISFFIAGSVQGLTLTLWSERASALYAANLVGSGLGCLLALGALNVTSAPGSVLVGALVAALAVWAFAIEPRVRGQHCMRGQRLPPVASAALVLGAVFLLAQSGFVKFPRGSTCAYRRTNRSNKF